jgi:hypothetical protein
MLAKKKIATKKAIAKKPSSPSKKNKKTKEDKEEAKAAEAVESDYMQRLLKYLPKLISPLSL